MTPGGSLEARPVFLIFLPISRGGVDAACCAFLRDSSHNALEISDPLRTERLFLLEHVVNRTVVTPRDG